MGGKRSKPHSDTKRPDQFQYYLDESISGVRLIAHLVEAGIPVVPYERHLERHAVTDAEVFRVAHQHGYVLAAADRAMDYDEIQHLIEHDARVILLTDKRGGVAHWAAALTCSYEACCRVLLGQKTGPVVIRVARDGSISKIRGKEELIERLHKKLTRQAHRGRRA